MSVAVAIEVVALIAEIGLGILQILPLIESSPSPGAQSIVRIGIGMFNGSDNFGGDVPAITVWNEDGKRLGKAQPKGTVQSGSFADVVVPQNPSNVQPTYVRVEGGSNSICIAYMGHAWPDGTKRGWLGDMGKHCNRQYYYSNVYVTQSNGTQHKPLCTWLGGSGSSADWTTQMTIHTPEFSAVGESNDFSIPKDPTSLCRSPATDWGNQPVASSGSMRRASLFGILGFFSVLGEAIDTTYTQFQNSKHTPVSPFQTTIVGSHYFRHNSTALCSNPMSYGPDFVSFHERVFCDMTNRRTLPLCSGITLKDCYGWASHTVVDRKLKKRKMDYSEIIEWK